MPRQRVVLSSGPALRQALGLFVLVGCAYFAGAQASYHWFGAGVSPVFFPSAGVTVAALLLTRRRDWGVVLAAAGTAELTGDLSQGNDLLPSLGWTLANVVEPLVGASLLRRVTARVDLRRRRDLIGFLAFPVALAPALGGAIGATTVALFASGPSWLAYAGRWWLGDGLGVLVVGGAIVSSVTVARVGERPPGRWTIEAIAAIGICTGAAVLVFASNDLRWAYVPVIAMSWIAIRLGTQAVALAGAGLAFVAAQAISTDPGFWERLDEPPRQGLVYLQLGIGLLIATALLVAAEVAERERAVRERASSEKARRGIARLLRLTAALAEERDPERLPERLTQELAIATGAVQAVLFVLGPDGALRARSAAGLAEPPDEHRPRSGGLDRVLARAVGSGIPVFLTTPDEIRSQVPTLGDDVRGLARAAWAVLPLSGERGRVGAVLLAFDGPPADEEDVFALLARQAGVAIERAALARATEAARREGERLRALIATLASAATVDQVAEAVVRESGEALGAVAATVGRMAARGGAFEVLAARGPVQQPAPVEAATRGDPVIDGPSATLPLVASSGDLLGLVVLGFPSPKRFSDDERGLMVAFARQAAQALERAELLREAERARARAELLATILTELDAVTGVERRARRLAELLVPRVADRASVELPGTYGPPSAAAHSSLDVPLPAGSERADHLVLRVELHDPSRRPYGAGDLAFLQQIASRAAVALEGARLLEREHDIAVSLQRALLPDAVVAHPRLTVAGRYRPGDDRLEVGGDWYETVALPQNRVGVGVGDVVGKGLEAAAAMGRLRAVVAALAPRCEAPSEVLDQLEAFAETLPDAEFSTACYAILDPATGELRHASAGHPPILLLEPRRAPRFLDGGRSWPLCSRPGMPRRDGAVTVPAGATLLLYSDGLIERRHEPLDAGLDRLAAVAQEHADQDVGDLCDAVIAAMTRGERLHDDIVVLGVRLEAVLAVPDPADARRLAAHPGS